MVTSIDSELRVEREEENNRAIGNRYAVIVQSDDLMLSTVIVAPTSRSAPPRIFRPTIMVNDEQTQVLIEQTSAVAPERLGDFVGRVTYEELVALNDGLRLVLELD